MCGCTAERAMNELRDNRQNKEELDEEKRN